MEHTETSLQRVRAGTAKRKGGRDTARKIVRAAYDTLMEGGHKNFSTRKIAGKAGIRLANLQYYYPRMDDLIHALLDYVAARYYERNQECMAQAEDNPEARFVAIIEFHIRDVNTPGTKNFFIQLWPLLGVADNYTGSLLVELYEPQLAHLGERILEINPGLDQADVAMRAELIASMIEGLTVTTRWAQRKDDYFESLTRMVTQTALGIARE